MATIEEVTKTLDMITPVIFNTYVEQKAPIKSALISSGVAVADEQVAKNITAGGTTVNMPFLNDIFGEDQVVDDGGIPIKTGKITSGTAQATVMYRGAGWSVNEMSAVFSGAAPMESLLGKLSDFWTRREQAVFMSVLKGVLDPAAGVLSDNGDGKHVLAAKGDIDMKAVIAAKQLLGDNADRLSMIAMNSAVYSTLQAGQQIVTVPVASTDISVPTYLGYRVIVDDAIAPDLSGSSPVYTTYLLASASFGRNTGTPERLTSFEKFRAAEYGTDRIFTRRAFTMHPYGLTWTGKEVAGDSSTGGSALTPSNADLANPVNWDLVTWPKSVGIVALQHTVPSDFAAGVQPTAPYVTAQGKTVPTAPSAASVAAVASSD